MTEEIKNEVKTVELAQDSIDTTFKFEPIELEMEDYDGVEFDKGVKETSHLAGVITALFNTGVSEAFILDLLLNKESVKHNFEVAIINRDTNIEIAKNQRVLAEKQEL